ncbi:UNVERIFIED_CONTAM: Ubiquinol-cytochrome-c reductase complex assembly factor 1 [Sesamum calycinum]|uniref:Ubiquinol-cytochrome-c reductase complex assembly factor 1 n=1 Tax=Sesamum calycinum TaxID=2727403 RepID=A0AAW2LV74_9LAMI
MISLSDVLTLIRFCWDFLPFSELLLKFKEECLQGGGRIFSHISRISNLQRSSELVRRDLSVFPLRNYAKVAAAVEPNVKSDTNRPEIHKETCTLQVNLNKMFWSKPCSLALATDSPNRIEDPQYEGVKRFILKLMLFYSKQSQFIRWANVIYHRVIYQVDRPAIYNGQFFLALWLFHDPWADGIHFHFILLPFSLVTDCNFHGQIELVLEKCWNGCLISKVSDQSVFSLEQTFKTTFSLLVLHMWLCLRRLKEEGKEGVELGQYLYEIYNHDLELRVSKAGVNLLLSKWMKELEKIFYGNIVAYDAAMGKQDDLQNVIWRD